MSSRLPVLTMLVAVGMLQIALPAQAAQRKGKRVSHSYPVGEILATVKQSAKPESNSNPNLVGIVLGDCFCETKKEGKPAEEKLIHLIVSTIQPDTWRQNGGRGRIAYEPVSMALVVHQTPAVQEEVADLLAALGRLMDVQVTLQVYVMSVSEACFERLGIDFEPAGNKSKCEQVEDTTRQLFETRESSDRVKTAAPRTVVETSSTPIPLRKAFLSDSQLRQLMEAAQADRHTNIMQAPRLTLLNGQAGTVNVCDTQYFLTGLNLEYKGGQVICKPNQQAFDLGTFISVLPTASADRKSVLVSLKFKANGLASSTVPLIPVQIPMKQVDKSGKEKAPELLTMFLQQPQVSTLSVEDTTVIPEGQTLVLSGIKNTVEGRNEYGPPVLSKIPYVNRFFKTVGYGRETTSLLIMVTPWIMVQQDVESKKSENPESRPPVTQVRFVQPSGMEVTRCNRGPEDSVFLPETISVPGRCNFQQGAVYRLRLKDMKSRPGLEVYPSLEVVPSNVKTEAFLAHSSVPVSFSDEEFEQIAEGKQIVKVVYLPDPQYQELTGSGTEVISSTQLDPGADPIQEALRRGSILVVIRMGDQPSHQTPIRVHGGIGP